MGCSSSRLDNAEAVQLCRDRKRFIEQAVEQRARFAAEHSAYIQSMKRVSAALHDYIQGDGPQEFLLDSFIMNKTSPGFMMISPKSFSPQSQPISTFKVNHLKSGGNSAVSVLERPQSPEIARIQAYSPINHCGVDGFFAVQSYHGPDLPPALPQSLQWGFFWDPFSSLDYYGYPNQSSLDQMVVDDETGGSKQVQEEEKVLGLEENDKSRAKEEKDKVDSNCSGEEQVTVENVDDKGKDNKGEEKETDCEKEIEHEEKALQSQDSTSTEAAGSQNVEVEVVNQDATVIDGESKEEAPNFTVYVNRKPNSMAEVIKDLEPLFMIICNSANEILTLLESSRAQYSSSSSETTAMKMLNPVALFHSASFGDESYESSSDLLEKSYMLSGSHQSTLDRLYAWEKKLYEEVRTGEKVRIAYEKKYMQLRDQNVKGDSSSAVDKTRTAIRDLQTRIKVSKHSIEVVSSRIETLRDEELKPQLLELLQGLKRMWEVMAECHQTQKQAIDETKILLAGTHSKLDTMKLHPMTCSDPQKLARSASNLETEIRNWRGCFKSWISCQRSYMQAMAGWLLRCVQPDPNSSKQPFFSPRLSSGALPIFGVCVQWARSLDDIQEMTVLDGLDSLATLMKSAVESECGGEVAEEVKMAQVGTEALCDGLSVAMNSLVQFSACSAEGYAQLLEQWEKNQVQVVA